MDNNIDINVIVNGEQELKNLSVSLRRMILSVQESAKATAVLDARQRALNAALGNTGRGLNDHAKSLRQAAVNQSVLGAEIKQTAQELKNLHKIAASGRGGAGMGALTRDLELTSKNLKKVKARTLITDLRGVGQEMKRLGKDAQFVGRSLIIGLTTPIVAFGRLGLQNLYAIDKQFVRLEKLLNKSREEFAGLTKAVTDFSYEFGISKELLLAVAGDFAELGINAENVLTGLTDLTAQFTILGDMEVSAAQDLTQSLYLGSLRAMEMSGEAARLGDTLKIQEEAMKNVNAQMYLFNALENATALSMREIADTLPEVSAAGLVFGLNFTEMMSLLAPMKAVGIDVSAAATGLKVSFQKLVNPTIKLQKELKQLQRDALAAGDTALAFDYENVIGAGMDSIQSLVDITDELMKSSAGGEGALKFYSQLFDDRQATRMLITMQDLANFQNGMFADSAGNAARKQGELVEMINKSLEGSNLFIGDIQSLSEVTALANARMAEGVNTMFLQTLGREVTRAEIDAAKQARKEFADYVVEQQKAGNDVIEQITSEAGKALMISFAGSASATARAEAELQKAKDSVAMSIDRIKIAFKNLTASFITDLGPTIKSVADSFMAFVEKIQNMTPKTRKLIAAFVAAAAAIGPLVFIFGQARLAGGVMLESIMKLIPGLKTLSVTSVASSSKLLNLKNGLTMTGNTIVNTNSRFSTFIATLASGNGPVAKLANSFGNFTGILKKTTTASADVTGALNAMSTANQTAVKSAVGFDAAKAISPKEKLAQLTAQEFDKLGFAGAAGQKVDIDALTSSYQSQMKDISSITKAGNQAIADSTKGIADKNTLVSKIQKGMTTKGYKLSADDLAKWQIDANGRVLNAQGKQIAGKQAQDFKNLVRYHEKRTGLALATERKIINGQQQAARTNAKKRLAQEIADAQAKNAVIQQSMAQDIASAKARNSAIASGEKQAKAAAQQRMRDELAHQKLMAQKQPFYEKRRISVSDTGEFTRKGRVISQASADRIAGGGIGSVIERSKLQIKQLTEAAKKPVLKLKDMATSPVRRFRNAVNAARGSVDQLTARNLLFGKTAPGAFARARVAAMAFGKSVLFSSNAFKILKMTMLATGIGAIVIGIGAAIGYVVKNFDTIRTQAKPGLDALKSAFDALLKIGKALITPFLNLFGTIGGGGKEGKNTADGIANAFNTVAKAIQKVAEFVEMLVNKVVVPLLSKFLGAIFNVIKGIMQFIQGIIKLKDNWREGLSMMWGALKKIGGAIIGFFLGGVIRPMAIAVMEVVKFIVKAFVMAAQGIVNALREGAKINIQIFFGIARAGVDIIDFILSAWALLPRGIGNAVEAGANIFADFIDGVADAVRGTPLIGWLADQAGLVDAARSGASLIRNIGTTIGNAGRGVADFMSSLVDPLRGTIDGLEGDALGLVDSVADAVNSFLGSIPEAADALGDWVAGVLEGFGQSGAIAGDGFASSANDAAEEGMEEGADEVFDPYIDAGGDAGAAAGTAAGENFLEKVAEIVKGLQQKFVDLVLDSVKGALDEATGQLEDALQKQKEAALAVYDEQLNTLEKLEKAEESLTREKEYQANRRRLIDERELQRANYQRNRALAIYEGRIDDARVLSLEDQKDQLDFQDKLTKTDEERRKDLVKENLDYLKESIKNAQEETQKMLDDQIKAFQDAAKEITKFPPLTIEEYTEQLGQLNDAAQKIAGENGEILKTMMTQMKDNLKMPNANVGVFSTGLDELVRVAQQKYGLTGSPDTDTIVGATIGMLAGIEGQIVGNRSDIVAAFDGIVTDVFDVASSFGNIADQIISPALDEMSKIFADKNPMKVFEQAVKDANETILREMQRTVGHVASLVDGLAKQIDRALIELAIAQEKISGGLGGPQTPSSPSTPGSPGSPSSPSTPSLPSMDALILQAVNQAFGSGIGNMLKIEEKNYLKQFTINSLKRAFTEPGFGMAHANTLKKNANAGDILSKISLQLWNFASKKLNLPVSSTSVPTVTLGPGVTPAMAQALLNLPRGTDTTASAGQHQMTSSNYFGGLVRKAYGGVVPGFTSQGVRALLHGGEYVINAKAVKNIGYATLEALNNMRYATPGKMSGPAGTVINETQNVNIYVDTFIGQEQWFESMMKEYNVKVVPRNQKKAGLENRTISTYSGINRGM